MEQPRSFINSITWWLWRYIIGPVFPFVRNILVKLHIVHHNIRQEWHIGWLRNDRTVKDFIHYLETLGFKHHSIAWLDTDEILGMRKLDGFTYQYHLRLFKDREIRGHYEKTAESHPIKHFTEETFEPRTEIFKAWLNDWLEDQEKPAPTNNLPHLAADH